MLKAALGAMAVVVPLLGIAAPARAQESDSLDMNRIFRCTAEDQAGKDACDYARSLVLANCTICHLFVRVVTKQATPEGWHSTLARHRVRLPDMSDEDYAKIEAYLIANFRPDLPPPDLPPEIRDQVENPL